jgi:hypothetical protein
MKNVWHIFLFLFVPIVSMSAQYTPSVDLAVPQKVELSVDTVYHKVLPEVDIYPRPVFKNRRQIRRFYRLIRDVQITLPYAKKAAVFLNSVNDTLENINGERARKAYIKQVEDELFKEFEQPLRKLTYSQGRLLIKLIDRECQQNSYALVKLYRGGFSAFFWQGVARIFGANLKAEYNPEGEDRMTEQIVQLVESGFF